MFRNIVIVCVGNICRSPTAEILLREALSGRDITISSAGIGALVDKPVEATAETVLRTNGHAIHDHRARSLTPAILHDADLVLAMERGHIDHILKMAPETRGKIFLLGKWDGDIEIPDPYRKEVAAFDLAYSLIKSSVSAWATRIR